VVKVVASEIDPGLIQERDVLLSAAVQKLVSSALIPYLFASFYRCKFQEEETILLLPTLQRLEMEGSSIIEFRYIFAGDISCLSS
jgi:hypothetical protein